MNRKTIIACVAVLAGLAALVAVAVFLLYSGTGKTRAESAASESATGLLAAVPSDAVMVVSFPDLKTACSLLADTAGCFHYFAGGSESGRLQQFLRKASRSGLGSLKSSKAALSLHYNGTLVPLMIVEAGRAGADTEDDVGRLVSQAEASGLSAMLLDGSEHAEPHTYLYRRNILLLSTSDVQPRSSERHIGKGISVLDSDGFTDCVLKSGHGSGNVYMSCREIGKFFTCVADRSIYGYADFLKKFSGWTCFTIDEAEEDCLKLSGGFACTSGVEDFSNVFRSYSPARPDVMSVLPSYTIFFSSLPLSDVSAYVSAVDAFADGTGRLGKIETLRRQLRKETGISPVQWASSLDVREVAAAFFRAGESVEKVLLLKIGNRNPDEVFSGEGRISAKDPSPKLCEYPYGGFASAVFGPFFSLPDEKYFTYIDEWIIVGSRNAVSEYVEGRATENTLDSFVEGASVQPDFTSGSKYSVSYLSVSEDPEALAGIFKPFYSSSLAEMAEGFSYVPVSFCISKDKDGNIKAGAEAFRVSAMKTRAPVFERDTVVTVPEGPFEVKNSGTGKMNLFYQQDNMYLCLKEVDGKGIWGVPFSSPICGCAGTVDYFANGKLQILFASGSRLYLIDRLGRFVNPFPVDLGKEILIGPGIYDFNGTRKYNVMILHKDNTIEMYNLQGRRPAQWKTITSDETIKGLPEAVKAGGKTYWVVRTSIQTLIFGFYGGEPLTRLEGDRMIRSDSRIVPADGAAVKAVCYDGKTHVIKLENK